MTTEFKLAISIALLEAVCFFTLADILCRKFALKYYMNDNEFDRDDDYIKKDDDNGNDYCCDYCPSTGV